jgi:succinoglycan biosynthesis transport protein ExoP
VITLLTLLATALGTLYVLLAPPTYTAEATIVIDPRQLQLFPKATFSEGQYDSSALESEIELVKSEPVALSVVNDLGLAKDPEFLGPQNILGALLAFASRVLPIGTSSKPLSESEATRAAMGVLSKNLTVKRVGLSYHLLVQYRSKNPTRAAEIANAVAEAYIAEQLEGKYGSTKRATQWLQGRIEELGQRQSRAERAVTDYKQENHIIAADGKLVNEQQMAELTSQIAEAHKKTSQAKARLDRLDAIIRDGNLDGNAAVADSLNNPIITNLRTRYLGIVAREATYSRKYGANHLAVVNLRDQIRDLRNSILEELKRIRESYLSEYEIAKQEEDNLEKRLAEVVSRSQTINQAQVPLRDLESSAQSSRSMYDNLRQRYTESLQQQSFPISDARILTSASPPSGKSGPRTVLILVLSVAGGLAFGVAVGTARELMNGTFLTSKQIESALQTACISIVPLVEVGKQRSLGNACAEMPASDQTSGEAASRTIMRDRDLLWTVLSSPFSRFAEAMRSIKLAVDLDRDAASSGRVIGFTSSLPHEGKSTISASLALLMAQGGARVILVDCDLRNPSLSRKLAPRADRGILDVIVGRALLEDAVWTERSTNLTFLPVSTRTRMANSSEVLAAAATKGLFEDLRSMYDYVIVDLAPLMPVVDTRATTSFVDAYVCVTEWGCTKVGAARQAFKGASNVYENLLGAVLNKADIDLLSTYDPAGGNYYRNKYYVQYGMVD